MFQMLRSKICVLPSLWLILALVMTLVVACEGESPSLDHQRDGDHAGISVFPEELIESEYTPGVVTAQGNQQAGIATFPHHFIPSEPGAGVAIDCGGTYPGLRGTYLCSISQVGNDITITYQEVDATELGGVTDETLTFSLAGGQADGVVTSGAFSANNENLVLTVTAGGADTTVSVPVPAAIRAGASLSDDDPEDVVETGAEEGTSTDVSRSDHVHAGDRQRAFGTHDPANIGPTAAAGTNNTVSRSDHAHGGQRAFGTTNPADVVTGTGRIGTADTLSRSDHAHGGDTDTTLSFGTGEPAPVVVGAGTVGTLGTAARSDHEHGGDRQRTLSDTNPLDVSRTSVAGASTEVSRQDHVHAGRSPLHIANATAVQTAQSFAFTVVSGYEQHAAGWDDRDLEDSGDGYGC